MDHIIFSIPFIFIFTHELVFAFNNIIVTMPLSYTTNGDWDNFLNSAKPDTANKYHEAVEEYAQYCLLIKKDMLVALSVKTYLQHRHDTPRMCKRDNKRFGHKAGKIDNNYFLNGNYYAVLK